MQRLHGVILLLLLCCYGWMKAATGELAELLWASHVTSALLAAGLVAGLPALTAIGFLWHAGVAAPAYVLHLLAHGDTNWASVLLHVLSPAFGFLAWRGRPLPRATVWRAWSLYLALLVLCRAVTPASANINLAFEPWTASPVGGVWLNRVLNACLVLALLAAARFVFNRGVRRHRSGRPVRP